MIPSPVCLTSLPPQRARAGRTTETGRVDDVGEEDGPEGALYVRFARRMGIEPTEEAMHDGLINLDDVRWEQSVGCPMGCLDGLLVRALDQAKATPCALFEPVRNEAHPEFILKREITHVGDRDVGSRRVREIMAVHVEGHDDQSTPGQRIGLGEGAAGVLAGWMFWFTRKRLSGS
jgi:hypothetical protein